MKDRQILVRDLLVLLALSGWALALPHYGSEFVVSMALTCLMYVALSSSWGMFCGSTRYMSLATSAFFGVGAYSSAIFLGDLSWIEAILLGAGLSAVLASARSGLGIAAMPRYVASDSLKSGHVVEVLKGHSLPEQEIHAVFPSPKLVPGKVLTFIAFMQGRLGERWWDNLPKV
jgi:DNA-binding transcriptional LysR family regulator